jgi:hypothetical protein
MLVETIKKYGFVILLCLAGCTAYWFFLMNIAVVDLTIHVDKRTKFSIYWSQSDNGYSENKMVKVVVTPERDHYQFLLTNLRNVKKLRLDPHRYIGKSTIEKISLSQPGIETVHFSFKDGFYPFKEINQITDYLLNENGLVVYSNGKDPFLGGDFSFNKTAFPWLLEIIHLSFICLVISIFYFTARHLNTRLEYVQILMAVVLPLVVVMAFSSKRNVHPDEYVHISASNYYQENWMPPSIEDPAIRHTYSEYGVSRLNNSEIFYFFAGKFAVLTSFLHTKPFLLFRLFNILLFSCLLLYTIKSTEARFLAIPLLISPQIWYVFSYCDSDAFSLFITFLAGVQIVTPGSMFNLYLKQQPDCRFPVRAILLGCLLGCLLLIKKNYYPYIGFIISLLGYQIWEMSDREKRILVGKRLLILTLIGLALFGLRRGADYYVNGLDKADKLANMRIETAGSLYNSKTDLSKQHHHLYMKKRGVPLAYIVKMDRFFEKTFRSAFGVYGYFTISASFRYYNLVRWTGVALLLSFLGLIFYHSWRENGFITVSCLLFSLALIIADLHHSWTKDFQAQGRYLFPIISMLGIVYARNHKYLNGRLFTSLFITMFLLSAYSFIFVAISQIPKI